jgi:FHA domain
MAISWKRKQQFSELRLVWLNACSEEPGEFRLLQPEAPIGSTEDNLFVIRKPSISRRHAILAFRRGRYEISDLGSTNGTFVNGHRINTSTAVEPGDEIRIGDAIFVLAKPFNSGIARPAGTRIRKKVLSLRGAFEAALLTFALGFGIAQCLAYLVYHEQDRLVLAKAVPLNQAG